MHTLKCFSVATKPHINLDMLMSLSKHFDLDIQLLGKNNQQLTEWGRNFSVKTALYHEALKNVEPKTIVLLSDSYDFLPLAPKQEIIDKFLHFRCHVVYNAEVYCHPIPELWQKYDELLPQNAQDRWRYLNSGCIIGYAGKILEILNHYPYSMETDDQGYHTNAFLDIQENKTINVDIKLDTKHFIAYTMAGDINGLRFDTEMLRFQTKTDGWPALFHFNGSIGETKPTFEKWNEYHKIPVTKYEF